MNSSRHCIALERIESYIRIPLKRWGRWQRNMDSMVKTLETLEAVSISTSRIQYLLCCPSMPADTVYISDSDHFILVELDNSTGIPQDTIAA